MASALSASEIIHSRQAEAPGGAAARGLQVEVRDAVVRFGDLTVLRDLELSIPAGQFLAVVGRSGCGKSTLLRLLAGLEQASRGAVSIGGAASAGLRSDVRVMFQDARLLPWKSVLDNVRIGVEGGDRSQALEALELVGLADRAKEWPSVLSGGQRQRVALARALVSNPSLLLLDEPLGALDALTRIEMQQLIERLWLERRFTAVLVTHDVSEAVALADRVVLVENGTISQDITIALARPREKDSGFSHYESSILNRVLGRRPVSVNQDGFAI
ncbi:ATP-binding cassette domain-containing protein [Paenibacillus sacheonensis]|uniref:ATP-binding cassette domain-containing protein n=1 Tax=Paenibacillus sacheonensis TaxID=742054 RepID=A0A7X4YLL8_9BACL|nr:ATP-binding cassette domain-containing protein [Paenibacillus sacheonensis]MBM7566085.1 sulfonate transport system ATP-binding protein [Paenibacillus sacheonensis]NBC68606.1 ATP-binding cassette domain-containing protein [Paenibacillus sacheonensis]